MWNRWGGEFNYVGRYLEVGLIRELFYWWKILMRLCLVCRIIIVFDLELFLLDEGEKYIIIYYGCCFDSVFLCFGWLLRVLNLNLCLLMLVYVFMLVIVSLLLRRYEVWGMRYGDVIMYICVMLICRIEKIEIEIYM